MGNLSRANRLEKSGSEATTEAHVSVVSDLVNRGSLWRREGATDKMATAANPGLLHSNDHPLQNTAQGSRVV